MSDNQRLPPGQQVIDKIIDIHLGVNPPFDRATWTLTVEGLAE